MHLLLVLMRHLRRFGWVSLRATGRVVRRVATRPEFLPVTFATAAGIVMSLFLTYFLYGSGPRTIVFLLYSLGVPACMLLALRRQDARAMALSLMFGALAFMVTALLFDMIRLPRSHQVHDQGLLWMLFVTFFASLVRNLRRSTNGTDGDNTQQGEE